MPNKHNAAVQHHIPKMKFKVANWAVYEVGFRRRDSLTLGHVVSLAARGWLGWQKDTDYGRRSLAETAITTEILR
ncbi:MAG: hypothetical protein ACYCTW_03845 [Sulfuricella sp.]